MHHHRVAALSVAASLGIALCACSSSGTSNSPSSDGSNGAGSVAAGSQQPIKLMVMGQLQASSFSFPDMANGAEAAADAINAAGGIDGRKVEITACNDGSDPNMAAECARQAVSGQFTALVGGVSLYYNDVFPILDAANIPVIGESPLNSAAATSSMSFPVDSNPAQFSASGIALVKDLHCTKVAVLYEDVATAAVSGQDVADGITWAGGQVTTKIAVPVQTEDYSAVISTALGSGANCIGTALAPAEVVEAVTALKGSARPNTPIASTLGSVPLSIVQALGKSADGIIVTNNAYAVNSSAWNAAKQAIAKASPHVQVENFGLLAWSSVFLFESIAKSIKGPITAASVVQAAETDTAIKAVGYPGTVDWTKPGPVKGSARLVNSQALLYVIKNGTYSLTSTTPIDTTQALSAAG